MKIEKIDAIMADFCFGKTGETIIVKKDGLLITESCFTSELIKAGLISSTAKMNIKLDTEIFSKAGEYYSGASTYRDYRGKKVIGVYKWLEDRNWIIIGKIDTEEVFKPFYQNLVTW